MGLDAIPQQIRDRYHIEERRHACAVLSVDCADELKDIIDCLKHFRLLRSEIVVGGGGKTKIAQRFDQFLAKRGWKEKSIKVGRRIDGKEVETETHRVDFCKGPVAVEVEWNNRDPFYTRDLNAFRLLHELGAISVGVIIARGDELREIFDGLRAGNCPLLLVGIM
ncbi:MAG: BglII/BstYI family type II restriction endonuclease [Terriglobales bacterium]